MPQTLAVTLIYTKGCNTDLHKDLIYNINLRLHEDKENNQKELLWSGKVCLVETGRWSWNM